MMTESRTLLFCNWAIRLTFCTIFIIYSPGCGIASAASHDEIRTVEVSYIIQSLGSDIGRVSARTIGSARNYDFQADTNVKVHFWFLNFSLWSREKARIRGGKLVSYHKTVDANGHHREISGELNGDILRVVAREGGKEEHKDFPVTGYITTNMEYPEMTLAPGEVRKMPVADLENTAIVDRKYRQVSEEHAKINGRDSRVIVSDFSDENAEGRRWTTSIGGLPIVLRQEGREKTGLFNPSYKVIQTKVTTGP
jgi:hypothetical protein